MKTTLWKLICAPVIVLFALQHGFAGNKNDLNKTDSGSTTAAPTISIELHHSVSSFAREYLKLNCRQFELIRENKSGSFEIIEGIFTQHNLPLELKYLAVVESRLKSSATSKAGAAGIWQLMPNTARALKLKTGGVYDERRNIHKSTHAAAKYLKLLYEMYDDWLLVLAAYNCGPGNVNKAIRKSGSHEFWKLQHFLPKETQMHVKKFIATHFYFEENGSIVTLTKKEREELLKLPAVDINGPDSIKSEAGTEPGKTYLNKILIINESDKRLSMIFRN